MKQKLSHLRFIIEKEGTERVLSKKELESELHFTYIPQLDFMEWSIFLKLTSKTAKFHKKGLLDHEQIWLGTYFQKEIASLELPSIRLKWIDSTIGWGIFAEKNLPEMYFVGEYAGLIRKRKKADVKNAYCFEYEIARGESTRYTIDALDQGSMTRFINHSEKPNLACTLATVNALSHVIFYTARPIKKGEQLIYNYGENYWKRRSLPKKLETLS